MFAMTIPGMAPLLGRELRRTLGVESSDSGFDGRADVVLFDVPRGGDHDVPGLRTAEDVFVEVGRTYRSEGDKAHWIAGRLWRPERVQRALSVWAEHVRPLAGSMSYRVVVRVLQEQSFLRAELRRQVTRVVGNDRPKWKVADPAQIEVWITEYVPGKILAGLRLSTGAMRQHDGRANERSGALRPAVASAMVQLAGDADGVLLDPCCGSGTILREAQVEGWQARGFDIDTEAVDVARHNVPNTPIEHGDARSLDVPDASVGACVSNLPFGEQYKVPGDPAEWLRVVLGEMARITRPGGHVVVLCPPIPRQSVPAELVLGHREQIRLLGLRRPSGTTGVSDGSREVSAPPKPPSDYAGPEVDLVGGGGSRAARLYVVDDTVVVDLDGHSHAARDTREIETLLHGHVDYFAVRPVARTRPWATRRAHAVLLLFLAVHWTEILRETSGSGLLDHVWM